MRGGREPAIGGCFREGAFIHAEPTVDLTLLGPRALWYILNRMTPGEQPPKPDTRADLPTWKELTEFINKQADNDRKVIDHWFKLASALLGLVLVVAAVVIGFVGLRTLADIRAVAASTAREAAKSKVEDVLKQPELQNLVRETASNLFEKGVFSKAIEARVRELLSTEIATPESRKFIGEAIRSELAARMAPRTFNESQRTTITESLRSSPGGLVRIRTGSLPEQQGYARKIYLAIKASPSWKDHTFYADSGSLAGLTNNEALLLTGIVVVVNDVAHPPDSARLLESALNRAGIGARLGTCDCSDPPKPPDIWLYVGEKTY